MRKIEDLSKQELLAIIYHHLGNTLYKVHPCECVACGTHPHDIPVKVVHEDLEGKPESIVYPYYYACDNCEQLMSEMEE